MSVHDDESGGHEYMFRADGWVAEVDAWALSVREFGPQTHPVWLVKRQIRCHHLCQGVVHAIRLEHAAALVEVNGQYHASLFNPVFVAVDNAVAGHEGGAGLLRHVMPWFAT